MVTFPDEIRNEVLSYHIDKNLIPKWDKVRATLVKEDSDRVYLVDGRERSRKSVFTFQQAKYLDRTFCLERICFTPEEFLKQLRTAKPGQVVVFDEAFRGLSSKASQSKVNKAIVQAMMEVGQKNLVVFIVLPTFFLLEIYAAVLRSNCLFHVYKSKSGPRKFRVYNYSQKSLLWNVGKKKGFSYAFPRVKARGTFFNKWAIDEKSYRKKKENSFGNVEVNKDAIVVDKLSKFKTLHGINYYAAKKFDNKLSKSESFRRYVEAGGTDSWDSYTDSIRLHEKETLLKGIDLTKMYKAHSKHTLETLYPKKVIKQMERERIDKEKRESEGKAKVDTGNQ